MDINQWLQNKWLCWGLGPLLSANIGYFGSVLFLELALFSGLFNNSLIAYGAKTRQECIQATRSKFSFMKQFLGSLWVMNGPSVIISIIINTTIMNYMHPITSANIQPPSLKEFTFQVFLLLLINDFFLYWGHRIQHMNEFLWKNFHSFHHQIDTPTAISTVYIDKTDATLQASLPMVIASILLRPHPFVIYTFMGIRLADNAINHSGIDSIITNILFLKVLPFRGAVGHHDAHHKFSNYMTNAKNYGEFFWIWDWMFGTYTNISDLMAARAASNKEKK